MLTMYRNDIPVNMIFEEERIATFKFWPFKDNAKCNKAKMAEAGFYSAGKKSEPDLAICYICCKELDGWEKDDDPWSEHQKHAQDCPFIRLGKKPSMFTLQDVVDLQFKHGSLMAERYFNGKLRHFEEVEELVMGVLANTERKENEKPKAIIRRKRSSRK